MEHSWSPILMLFKRGDVWTRKNLLRSVKNEAIVDEAIILGYIEQCGTTDIGEPRYCITELGIKIRDN